MVYNGVIYISASSNEEQWADTKCECCSFVASMVAVDLKTGKVIWKMPMVPKGYTGGLVASDPAIADGIVFWGSGDELLNSATVHRSVGNDTFHAFGPAVLLRNSRLIGRN